MKRILSALLILALCLSLASVVTAEAPAAGSLRAVQQTIRGNSSWTPESYPEVWITPIFGEYIVEGRDPERYPANFLRFAPPEGAAPVRFEYDFSSLVDFDTLLQYSYQAHDRASYELFLERAEEEHILADGSGGVAVYVAPDRWGRGRAMIDLKPYFGGTSKLWIEIYDNSGSDLSGEELGKLIQDEVARVQAAMEFVELDRYWSQDVYASADLFDDHNNVTITVDTAAMTITRLQDKRLVSQVLVDGKVRETEIQLSSPYGDDLEEATLADGTPYLRKTWEYWSEAYFFIQEGRYSGEVHLLIKIGVAPEDFAAELEKVYPLVTLPGVE